MTETPDISVGIARRSRICLMCIKRHLLELYNQPEVELSPRTRKIKAEAIKALLYE